MTMWCSGSGTYSWHERLSARLNYTRIMIRRFLYFRYRVFKLACFRSLRALVFVAWRQIWIKKVENIEKLPRAGPALVISNHVSHFDWAVLASILHKQVVFISAQELTNQRLIRWLTRWNIIVYVNRERTRVQFLREVLYYLKKGKVVVIYPEGTRSRTGKRQPVKSGFVKLALLTNSPLIPVGIRGTYNILSPHRSIPRLARCEVSVGDPIAIDEDSNLFGDIIEGRLHEGKLSKAAIQEIGERIMDVVGELAGPEWDDGVVRSNHKEIWQAALQNGHEAKKRIKSSIHGAFFDIDKTAVNCHTQRELALLCREKRLLTTSDIAKVQLWFALSKANLVKDTRSFRESFYRGFSLQSLEEWDRIFDELTDRYIRPKIFARAASLIRWHRKQGHRVVLVSASISAIAKLLQQILGADDVLATELEIKDGKYTGKICGGILEGFAKARAIRLYAQEHDINLEQSYAYGNGFSDVRMLTAVGYPTAVNPDRRLRQYARRRGWPVLYLR